MSSDALLDWSKYEKSLIVDRLKVNTSMSYPSSTSGDISATTITTTGNATIGGNVSAVDVDATGDVTVGATLDVTGTTTTGALSITNNASVGGNLTVTGSTTVTNGLIFPSGVDKDLLQLNASKNALPTSLAAIIAPSAGNSGAIQLGLGATTSGLNAIGFGSGTTASGAGSVAIGNTTTTSVGDYAVSIGSTTTAGGLNAVSIGKNSSAAGDNSVSIGPDCGAFGTSVAIGKDVTSNALSIAIGTATTGSSSGGIILNASNSVYSEDNANKFVVQLPTERFTTTWARQGSLTASSPFDESLEVWFGTTRYLIPLVLPVPLP